MDRIDEDRGNEDRGNDDRGNEDRIEASEEETKEEFFTHLIKTGTDEYCCYRHNIDFDIDQNDINSNVKFFYLDMSLDYLAVVYINTKTIDFISLSACRGEEFKLDLPDLFGGNEHNNVLKNRNEIKYDPIHMYGSDDSIYLIWGDMYVEFTANEDCDMYEIIPSPAKKFNTVIAVENDPFFYKRCTNRPIPKENIEVSIIYRECYVYFVCIVFDQKKMIYTSISVFGYSLNFLIGDQINLVDEINIDLKDCNYKLGELKADISDDRNIIVYSTRNFPVDCCNNTPYYGCEMRLFEMPFTKTNITFNSKHRSQAFLAYTNPIEFLGNGTVLVPEICVVRDAVRCDQFNVVIDTLLNMYQFGQDWKIVKHLGHSHASYSCVLLFNESINECQVAFVYFYKF